MQCLLKRARLAMIAPVVAMVCSVVAVQAADTIPAERRLGNDVVAYFSIRNVTELKTAFGNTQLGQLVKDPELAGFLKQFEEPLAKFTQQIDSEVGIPFSEISSVPQGEIAIAVVHSAGKPMGVVAFLDFGDKKEIVEKLLEKMDKGLTEDDKAKRSEEEVEGSQVVVYTFPVEEDEDDEEGDDEAAKKPGTPATMAYLLKDTQFVIASRVDILKNVLTRWDGQHERIFAEKQSYKYIREKCSAGAGAPVPHMTFFVDPIGILKGGMAMSGVEAGQSAMVLGMLPSLGLDKLKGLGGTIDMGTEEFDTVTRMLIYVEQPPTGVLNAFQFPVKNLTPPKWVEADVSTYAGINWDIAGIYTTVETLYDTFAGQGALEKIVDQLAEEEGGPKIHIKKDFVDQVTGTIIVVGKIPEQSGDEVLVGERYLIGLELKDEAAMKKVLENVADIDGFPGEVREFEGEKVFELSAASDDDTVPTKPAVAIVKKHLMFATHVAELEAALRNDGDKEALADSEVYKSIAKRFPEQSSSVSFQRSETQIKMVYEALKSGALTEALDSEDFELDTSSLPEFETLRKYFLPSGGYMQPDENGYFMMGFSLRSKAE